MIQYLWLRALEPDPNNVGITGVTIVDQEGCGINDEVGVLAGFTESRITVRVKYHVDTPQPIPGGAFDLSFGGTTTAGDGVFTGEFGPLPQLRGNERGGKITFTVRAVNNDAANPTIKVYTKRFVYPLDGCPGQPEQTPGPIGPPN